MPFVSRGAELTCSHLQPCEVARASSNLIQAPCFGGRAHFGSKVFDVSRSRISSRAAGRGHGLQRTLTRQGWRVEVVELFKVKGKASARNLHQIILTGLKPYAICGHSRICSWHSSCLQTDRRHPQLTMAFYGTSEMT